MTSDYEPCIPIGEETPGWFLYSIPLDQVEWWQGQALVPYSLYFPIGSTLDWMHS